MVKVTDANRGELSEKQNGKLMTVLNCFIDQGLFPTDPK